MTDKQPTIRDWQCHFESVYPNPPDKIATSEIMVHVFSWCGEITRPLMHPRPSPRLSGDFYTEVDRGVVKAFSWISALASRFAIDMQDALLGRFPSACPHCLTAPCRCSISGRAAYGRDGNLLPRHRINEELAARAAAYRNDPNFVLTPDWMVANLHAVYPANSFLIQNGHTSHVAAKFIEEGSEIQGAYSAFQIGKGTRDDIASEIADLSAWVLTCWDIEQSRRSLGGAIQEIFGNGCPKCLTRVCKCEIPDTSLLRSQQVRVVRHELEALGSEHGSLLIKALELSDHASAAETLSQLNEARRLGDQLIGEADASSDPKLGTLLRRIMFIIPETKQS